MKGLWKSGMPALRAWLAGKPRTFVAGAAGLALLLGWVLYAPSWISIQRLRRERDALRSELDSSRGLVAQARAGSAQPLLPVGQAPEVLARLEELAGKHGLKFLEISPGKPRAEEPGQAVYLPVDLQIEGAYRPLGEFLGELRGAQALATPVLVREVHLARDERMLPNLRARVSLELALTEGAHVPTQ